MKIIHIFVNKKFKNMNTRIFKPVTAIIAVLFAVATTFAQRERINPEDGVWINGVVWAKYNVDAPGTFAAKPEDAGMFYQWNSKVALPATGNVTRWNNNVSESNTWERVNDPSPAGWRVPTLGEIKTLFDFDYVSNEWTEQNGINGVKFTDKATGNSIFLPAVGFRADDDGMLYFAGEYGHYWGSTAYESCETRAYYMCFKSDLIDWYNNYRRGGFSVRAVED
jgi:uncharacterized protein (TIGR02145 family)